MSSSADEISRVGAADAASDLAAVQPEGFFTDSLRRATRPLPTRSPPSSTASRTRSS